MENGRARPRNYIVQGKKKTKKLRRFFCFFLSLNNARKLTWTLITKQHLVRLGFLLLGRLDCQDIQVVEVLLEGHPQGRRIVVRHAVLFAHRLDNGVQISQVAVIDAGEQVMFNLVVEAASEQESQVAVVPKGVRGDDLSKQEEKDNSSKEDLNGADLENSRATVVVAVHCSLITALLTWCL